MVSIASSFPFTGGGQARIEVDGRPLVDRSRAPQVYNVAIADNYFEMLQAPLVRGRVFAPTDGRPGAGAVIVNERFAAQMFEGTDPVGQRIRLLDHHENPWLTILGVAPNIRQGDPQKFEADPVIYQPFRQDVPRTVALLIRTSIAPASVMTPIRAAVRDVNSDQPLYNLRTYDDLLSEVSWLWRVFGTLFVIFAAIALLLSAIGLYAVTAYSVAQRTQEIGVRMALGAEKKQVSWMILRRGLVQLGIGTAIGLIGSYFAAGLLQTWLVQMSPHDPATFMSITGILLLITTVACLLPARRAMRVDPVVCLRAE
jgi:predicted permease